jgi:WD40 repeat protein
MSFFVTGGTLGPEARSYVQRQADRQLLEGLLQGEFCYVLTSRQMGKSSLMLRAASRLEELGIKVATIDLTAIGAQDVSPEQWYYGLLDLLGEALDLREPLEVFWRQNHKLGPLQRLMTAIREVLLPSFSVGDTVTTEPLQSELRTARGSLENSSLAQPHPSKVRLVIFLDEIDIVRSLGFSVDGFFAAIRECYNRRAQDPAYESIAFCLLGVATPTDLIRDARRTPFNIGRRVELNDFSTEEADPLASGLVTANVNGEVSRLLLARILHWTGGHPYLTQRFCQETADFLRNSSLPGLGGNVSTSQVKRLIDQFCAELFLSNHALRRDPNLSFVSEHFLRSELERASLLDLYRKVLRGYRVPDDELDGLANQLKLAGIVRGSTGRLVVRNRIYERAFDREWIRANMPAAELRRQREAFRHGVVLTTAISLFVLTIMAGLTIFALQAKNSARLASARAHFSEAKAQRMSGRSGQRLASLAALESARRYHTNRAELLEEATAALTLMDLQKRPDWNPDRGGKITAVTTDLSVAAQVEPDSSVTLFNLKNEAVLGRLPQLSPKPRRLRFSPNGTYLLVDHEAESGGQLSVWNWSKPQQLFTVQDLLAESRALDFTRDEKKLAVGTSDSRIEVYSLPSGTLEPSLHLESSRGLPRIPDLVRFSPGGEFLAEACWGVDNRVQIWRLADGLQVGAGVNHTARINDIAWGDGGRYLGTACADEVVHVKDMRDIDKPAIRLRGHSDAVLRIAFSHRGSLIASMSRDGTLRLWSLASESQLVLHPHEPMDELRFSTEDDHLICSAADGARVDLLQVHGNEHVAIKAEGGRSRTGKMLDFSGDGERLLAALSGHLIVFELNSLRETARVPFASAHGAYFNSTGDILVSTDAGLFRYSIGSTLDLNQFAAEPMELGAIALSPNRQLSAVIHRNQILLFEMGSVSLLSSNAVGQHYHHLALHPRGQWLAGMSKGSETIELWNLEDKPPAAGPGISPASEHFAFDPSGRWLITSLPGGIKMLEVGNWRETPAGFSRKEHAMPAGPMAVNTSGTVLAVASSFHRVELWRMPRQNEHAELELMTALTAFGHVESLVFSADHTWLAAITKDTRGSMIELWNLKQIWAGLRPYLEKRFELTR